MPDRGKFFEEIISTLDFLLLHPASPLQRNVTLAVVILVVTLALAKLHKWGRAARGGFFLSLATVTLSGFFLLIAFVWGGAAIEQIGLVERQQMAAMGLLLGVAFFAGVAPLTRFCLKAAYFTSVASWILALLLGAGTVYLSQSAWQKINDVGKEKAVMEG